MYPRTRVPADFQEPDKPFFSGKVGRSDIGHSLLSIPRSKSSASSLHHNSRITLDSTAITRTTEKCRDSVAICNVSICLKTPFDLVVSYSFWTLNSHFEISKGWRQSPRSLATKLNPDIWRRHAFSGIISLGVEDSGEFASRDVPSYSFWTLNSHFEISKGWR